MILASHGIIGSSIGQFVGLLDAYPNAAAAYSLRKLKGAYTGSAIRVRRSSDNTELDIGFALNQLDTSALTNFCSGTNGFVKTWYDQSGNARNATQTTALNQPQIVSSGSLIVQNSKPIIRFSVTNELNLTGVNVNGLNSSFFMTYKKSATGDNDVLLQDFSNYLWLSRSNTQYYGNATVSDADFNTTNYMLVGATMNFNVKLNWYINNILEQSKTSGFADGQGFGTIFPTKFMRIESFSNEIIIYTTDQDLNASGIQTNMNNFYSIY